MRRAQADLEVAQIELADFERALAREQKLLGLLPQEQSKNGLPDPNDKGAMFERFAKRQGLAGFTIAEIFRLYNDANVTVGKNYPYFLVDTKYKEQLRREGGTRHGKRYYWMESETTSA